MAKANVEEILNQIYKAIENIEKNKRPWIIYSTAMKESGIIYGDGIDVIAKLKSPFFNKKKHKAFIISARYKEKIEFFLKHGIFMPQQQ